LENSDASDPKIFIGGDSWGCGEWADPIVLQSGRKMSSTVSHRGLEQYFINDNYTVFNSSKGGSSNRFSIERLAKDLQEYYSPGDIILWIQSDPIRDLRVHEHKHGYRNNYSNNISIALKNNNNNFTQLEKCLLADSYDKLSNLANAYNTTVHVIGGLRNIESNILSKFKNLNMLVKSWIHLLINKYGDDSDGIGTSEWTVDDFLIDQLPVDVKLQLVDDLYKIFNQHQSITKFKIFSPDGEHPNRKGHEHLYNFIKEKLNL
jgi:hypothetical protein